MLNLDGLIACTNPYFGVLDFFTNRPSLSEQRARVWNELNNSLLEYRRSIGLVSDGGQPYITEEESELNYELAGQIVYGNVAILGGAALESVGKLIAPIVGKIESLFGRGAGEYGTLSNVEARQWYLQQEARIPKLIGSSASLEEQAMQASQFRNQFRAEARNLMADRNEAARLLREEPNMTWEEVVNKYQARGYQGDDLWNAIIEGSQRSRPSVNQSLGL